MKPKCKLIGENDNVFNLLALTRKALREHGKQYLLDCFEKDISKIQRNGGTYDDVLRIIMQYVEVE
ncbi:hypothetical protein SAMN02745220_04969 [Desulfopila aestuarii DSM 18488]|uniref:Uncharacterized protein n=2 Tax=Desulfopila aestuarii TaxID=231440 RepID=A0A1M7YKL3_9BACT|nr:hypothetical protein SAMN02745220_04969 [Desulfopila aestuarii DSM 18488]